MKSRIIKARTQRIIDSITSTIGPLLESGFQYYAHPIKTDYGQTGGGIYRIVEGAVQREEALERTLKQHLKFGSRLFDVVKKFPAYTKVNFVFEQGKPTEVKASSPQMLLADIAAFFKTKLEETGATKVGCSVAFFENGGLELDVEGKLYGCEPDRVLSFFEINDIFKCLYHALASKVEKIQFTFDGEVLMTQSSTAFPALGITALADRPAGATIEPQNLDEVFEYIESGEPHKLSMALQTIGGHQSWYQAVEDRYLNLVKARLNNEAATLEDLPKAMLNKVEVKLLTPKYLGKNAIHFAYLNGHECKVIVDFVGAMVRNFIDINDFMTRAVELKSEEALLVLVAEFSEKVQSGLEAIASTNSSTWLSNACKLLHSLACEQVLFEKTSFTAANQSTVLNEFYFFIGMSSEKPVYLDIHQSEVPQLTEIFWMLRRVPKTNWSDVTPHIEKSPLSFSRKASMRVNSGAWKPV